MGFDHLERGIYLLTASLSLERISFKPCIFIFDSQTHSILRCRDVDLVAVVVQEGASRRRHRLFLATHGWERKHMSRITHKGRHILPMDTYIRVITIENNMNYGLSQLSPSFQQQIIAVVGIFECQTTPH